MGNIKTAQRIVKKERAMGMNINQLSLSASDKKSLNPLGSSQDLSSLTRVTNCSVVDFLIVLSASFPSDSKGKGC